MLTVRSALLAALSLLLIADTPGYAQRKPPPTSGDKDEGDGTRGRRAPPSGDRGWKVRKPPRVQGFAPQTGAPGTTVTISGQHFGSDVRVRFNGRDLRIVGQDDAQLKVVIPGTAVSDHFVISKPGFDDVSASTRFEVIRPPRIQSFRPPRGDVGITVTIRGEHFLSSDQVVINDRPMRVISVEPRRIAAEVPSGALSGKVGIRRGGRVVSWSRGPFVVSLPPPTIASFSPPSGPAGTLVRLSGSNFDPTDVVELGERRLPVRRRGADFLEVVVQRGASGPFVVRGPGGRHATSSSQFVLVRPPLVRSFSPAYGPPGTQLTIVGEGFLRGDQAFVGPAQLTTRTVSPTQIVAELPAGVDSGRVYVKRDGQTFQGRGVFKVVHGPSIASVTPLAGPPGTTVTIRGDHFAPGVSVLLSGRTLPVVRRRLPSEITVRIPPDARTGRLVVVTRGGSAQSPDNFVIQPHAVLESFFPLRGVPGTSVTLKGQHFHQGMQLRLAGKPLTIDQLRPGTVVVTIPEGATSGRFSIETHGRQLTSRLPFAVDQPKPELSFTFAPPVARRGTDVTLTLDPPRQGVTVYLDDRPLPKRVLENGRRLVVTVPGDARSRGDLEVEYRGRKYRADRPLRIR